jgi:hypothetical protein
LLGSVEDYSGTVRQAINLLEYGFSVVLLVDHRNGESTIRQGEILGGVSTGHQLLLPEPQPQEPWFDPKLVDSHSVRPLTAPTPPAAPHENPANSVSRQQSQGAVSGAVLDVISAGIDRTGRIAARAPDPVVAEVSTDAQQPIVASKKPQNAELLSTIGAGIDTTPVATKAPVAPLAERLKKLSPEERAALAAMVTGSDNSSTPKRGES